jgi:transaldolase
MSSKVPPACVSRPFCESWSLLPLAPCRGVTDNPSIFEKAVLHSDRYDDQYTQLIQAGKTVEQSYWELQVQDINDALEVSGNALRFTPHPVSCA